jgi:predicted ATPase
VDINYVSEIPSISSGRKADTQYRKFFIYDNKLGMNLPFDKVGTGISQIVPILTSLFTSGENLLYIEQPEIHLHPAMQATLMDAILEASLENDKQIIIETHSETFLLRALRRMREGRFPKNISPVTEPLKELDSYLNETPENRIDGDIDSVMVYYFDNKSADSGVKQTTVRQMRLDGQGRLIDDWPGGFFEEGVREVLM